MRDLELMQLSHQYGLMLPTDLERLVQARQRPGFLENLKNLASKLPKPSKGPHFFRSLDR